MNIRTIIIDDEQHCIDTLLWQIEKYTNGIEIVAQFNSPTKALKFLDKNTIDLVFLDIEMPEMNGFQFLKKANVYKFDVIFATAYDEFAVKAFKASAIDYLLKPIDKDDLVKSIDKVKVKNQLNLLPEQMEILYGAIQQPKTLKDRIALPTQDGLHFIKTEEIVYCISDSNYTHIYLISKKNILVSKTLKEIESLLSEDKFLRIHHSNLINLEKVEKYVRGDGGYVIMDDQKELSVSRSRKDMLLKMFGF